MPAPWSTLSALWLVCLQHGASASANRKSPIKHVLRLTGLGSRLVVEIPVIQACEASNNAISYSNVSMNMLNKVDYVVDADLSVSRGASSLREVHVELTKCREAVSSSTCEYFQTWRFKDKLCAEWNDPSKPWSEMLRCIQPRPDCPIKQGEYRIRNGTLDLKVLQKLPIQLEGSVWVVRASMIEDNGALHMCTEIQMEPHRVRD